MDLSDTDDPNFSGSADRVQEYRYDRTFQDVRSVVPSMLSGRETLRRNLEHPSVKAVHILWEKGPANSWFTSLSAGETQFLMQVVDRYVSLVFGRRTPSGSCVCKPYEATENQENTMVLF